MSPNEQSFITLTVLPCILPVLQQDRMVVLTGVCLTANNNLQQQQRRAVTDYSLHVLTQQVCGSLSALHLKL